MVKKKRKLYSINVEFDKNKYSKEQLKIKKAIAEAYASSPFKTKKSKNKDIRGLFN